MKFSVVVLAILGAVHVQGARVANDKYCISGGLQCCKYKSAIVGRGLGKNSDSVTVEYDKDCENLPESDGDLKQKANQCKTKGKSLRCCTGVGPTPLCFNAPKKYIVPTKLSCGSATSQCCKEVERKLENFRVAENPYITVTEYIECQDVPSNANGVIDYAKICEKLGKKHMCCYKAVGVAGENIICHLPDVGEKSFTDVGNRYSEYGTEISEYEDEEADEMIQYIQSLILEVI